MFPPLSTLALILPCLAVQQVPGSDGSPYDTARPQMPWQRSLDDALAVSRATGKPLLICVNMDGESASESLANGRYHDATFVGLADGFVPIIVSPNKHGDEEYDTRGRRIVDARFGRILESEHLGEEARIFREYFSGRRVAPRHVGVSPDGKILFDLFLLGDLGTIDRTLDQYGKFDAAPVDVATLSDDELLESADAAHRDELEARFERMDEDARARLATLALSTERATQHPQLVRIALHDAAERVRHAAVRALVANPLAPGADQLLPRAFASAQSDPELRAGLLDAAKTLARAPDDETRKRGIRLASVFEGLLAKSTILDVGAWLQALAAAPATIERPTDVDAATDRLTALDAELRGARDDVDLNVRVARAALDLADLLLANGGNPSFVLEDAASAARRALAAGPNPEATACVARADYLLGNVTEAASEAAAALPGLMANPADPLVRDALDCLAKARVRDIYAKLDADETVPHAWIADARAAYRILAAHPAARSEDVIGALEFFDVIEAFAEQTAAVLAGIVRHYQTGELHVWLRHCILRDRGIDALEEVYDRFDVPAGEEATFEWHAALATLIAAESLGRDGRIKESIETYRTSAERFLRSLESRPDFEGSVNHYLVLARSGLARRLFETGALDAAVEELRAASHLVPSSFAEKDGLGRMPRDTVEEVLGKLRSIGRRKEAEAVRKELLERKVRLD